MKTHFFARMAVFALGFWGNLCVGAEVKGGAGEAAPATVAELARRVKTHVTAERFAGAEWGVKVVSLDTGEVLVESGAERLLSPASNCKLYVGAMALTRLGGDYRIVTPVMGTARLGGDGVLRGDLVVSGRGDPSWRVRKGGAKEFSEIFEPFVAVVRGAGVRRITGAVVGDATWMRMGPHGAGWSVGDLSDYYGAEVSAITLADNCVRLRYGPGGAEGEPARLELLEPLTRLLVDNRTRTVGRGGAARFGTQRYPDELVVRAWGEVPIGARAKIEDVPVPRPAEWFAAGLRAALERAGIAVDGGSRGVRWPEEPAAGSEAVRLGEVVSPTMRELVADFMKPSQNLQTDLIFGHIGELARGGNPLARRTSEHCAVTALGDFLRTVGVPAGQVEFEEGSGLSRNNLVTANATVAVLAYMARHAEAEDFRAALPVAGVDGTLRARLKGTAAEGNVRAKTGTLRWAAGLSGYVTTAAGERLAFSLLLNRYAAPEGRTARAELDAIAVWLASLTARTGAAARP